MTSPSPVLSILLWNANGVRSHTTELTTLLTDKQIDIALITETHLTANMYFSISGYQTYRTDHPHGRAQGGTAILIRSCLSHHLLPCNHSIDSLQHTTVKVNSLTTSFTISSVYCPPNKRISTLQYTNFFNSLGPRFLCGGDYNAKHPRWGSRINNARGRTLYSALTRQHSFFCPDSPTYWPTDPARIPDVLDFFIHKGLDNVYASVTSLACLSSDHSPLLLKVSLAVLKKQPPPSFIRGPINWRLFEQILSDAIDLTVPLKSEADLDDCVHSFTTLVQESLWHSSTPSTSSLPTTPLQTRPLPQHIQDLLLAKRQARTLWQTTRNPAIRTVWNRLCNQVKTELNKFRSDSFNTYLSSLSTEDRSLWRSTKKLLKYHPVSPPIRRNDGTWAASDEEKSQLFSQHLRQTFTPHPDPNNQSHLADIQEFLDSPLPMALPPKAVTPSEVRYIISHLPKRKSPGYDLLTANILRHFPPKAILLLTYIFNCIFRIAYFPVLWKHSIIILFPKPGKPAHDPSSYRPISLLPLLSKVFEKIILKRLLPVVESNQLLPNHQFGFRSHHSTTQQGLRVVNHINLAFERKQYCAGAFLDVAQAFDRVWQPGLLYKLKRFLPQTLYLVLRSYLTDRFFRVRQGSDYSDFYPLEAGVPQGSVLGPILYTIYTADIPTHPDTFIATYADDTVILSSDWNPITATDKLQSHLNDVSNWCKRWRIKLNANKSTHIMFTLCRSPGPTVILNNIPLPTSTSVHYLGFHLDTRLTWSSHLKKKRQELNTRFGQLRRLLNRNSSLSTYNKLTIYKSLLKPIWTYGIELWGSAKPSNIRRIQTFQSKVLRVIVDAPFYVSNKTLHTDLQIPYVHDLIPTRFSSLHSKFQFHLNPLVQSLTDHPLLSDYPRRLKRTWPHDIIIS